jgi:hypothetical protein
MVVAILLPTTIVLFAFPFCLGAFFVSAFVALSWIESFSFLVFLPVLLCACTSLWRGEIAKEKALARQFGVTRALWFEEAPTIAGRVLLPVAMVGWDLVIPPMWSTLLPWIRLQWPEAPDFVSIEEIASVFWVGFITFLDAITAGPNVLGVSFVCGIGLNFWRLHIFSLGLLKKYLRVVLVLITVIWLCDSTNLVWFCLQALDFFTALKGGLVFTWLKWRVTHMVVWCTVAALSVSRMITKYTPEKFSRISQKESANFASIVREKLMQATIFVSDLGLPHYIRGTRPPTKEGLQDSLDILRDLGWPVNVSILDSVDPVAAKHSFQEWVLCGTDWQQGIRNLQTYTDELLEPLREHAIEFRRTEEYATVDNELVSTSRYFHSPIYDYPDLEIDDVWYMVKDTFHNSKLTPMNYIIGMWEKKYGLGAFFRKPGSRSKLSRKDFIRSIGGLGPFKRLWRRTFEFATIIVPVSAVSVKGEALGPNKWMNDKVRSIIGTPLVHYIMSTFWNYEPNHRFAWTTTPTKIGMPLNGYWLADLYHRHSRCQHHFAGDMSAFDSTITGKVVDIVKGVRKKGFENHRDYDRLCELIDVGYAQLDHQLLNTTSTGNIYKKGTGLTTGHSSTSMDNSLALLTLYLLAWKDITGLGAKEFKFFNELSDYGDDHVLSFLATKPAAWNFKNIQKTMARWGVTNRLEASGNLDRIPFLSKFSRRITAADKAEFDRHNLPYPKRVVFHDKDKLLGKMVARVKNPDPRYRAKRLLSYLSLTAHHNDLYNGIYRVLTRSSTMKRALRSMKVSVPTYQKVLADWYHPSVQSATTSFDEEQVEAESVGRVFHYGQVGWFDTFLGAISIAPDVVNPALFNFGYDRVLQLQLRSWLEWPITFLVLQNSALSRGELNQVVRKTAYRSLIPDIHSANLELKDPSCFLLRHWGFMFYKYVSGSFSSSTWVSGIAFKMLNWQFVLNGTLGQDFAVFNWAYLDLVVICLLNLIPCPSGLSFMGAIVLPRVDLIWNAVTGWLFGLFWTNVPPNYRDLTHHLRALSPAKSPLLIESPTGTGKSTAMIKHISLTVGHLFNRIVVVEPRSLLVHTLVPFVRDHLNVDCTGRTSGIDFDKTRKVWYVTAQEALLHVGEVLSPNNLIVVDEAHLEEPAYIVLKEYLRASNLTWLMSTATPTDNNRDVARSSIPLVVANIWNVHQASDSILGSSVRDCLNVFEEKVVDMVKNSWSRSKILVFHPSKARAKALAERLPRKTSLLNSDSMDISGQVIISTSVSDAGVTLPDVDFVVSLDFDITGVDTMGVVEWAKLSAQTLSQRKGRTGRTNNGTFVCFQTPNLSLPLTSVIWADRHRSTRELLRSGIDLSCLGDFGMESLRSFITKEVGFEDPLHPSISKTLAILKSMLRNEQNWHLGRTLQSGKVMEPDHAEILFDYTAAGNVSEKSLISTEEVGDATISLASCLGRHFSGMSFDINKAVKAFSVLVDLPALEKPFRSIIPVELSVEFGIEPEDPEYQFELSQKWDFMA